MWLRHALHRKCLVALTVMCSCDVTGTIYTPSIVGVVKAARPIRRTAVYKHGELRIGSVFSLYIPDDGEESSKHVLPAISPLCRNIIFVGIFEKIKNKIPFNKTQRLSSPTYRSVDTTILTLTRNEHGFSEKIIGLRSSIAKHRK